MTAAHDDVYFTCGHCNAIHDMDGIRRGLSLGQRRVSELLAAERGEVASLARRFARRRVMRALIRGLRG